MNCKNFLARFVSLLILCNATGIDAWGATPEVQIASGPLYGGRGNVHPNMLLSLSLEFPSAGIAYRDDGNYNRTLEYSGYFNPAKCYTYHGGNRNIRDGYFASSKAANALTHECGGNSFSGNFMNWAASSALDILRYALTGGDRIVDAAGTTILQRAVLKESFYADATYFPRRRLTAGGEASAPNQVTPFDVPVLYVVSCRNRILFSDKNVGGNCDTPAKDAAGKLLDTDKRLGEYLARVKVCDSPEGASRADLCQKFGSDYKPVGEIQRNAEKIRFAAMGYLLDDSPQRYGGVLRAPMKYVGAKKFDAPGFGELLNDRLEWNPATGVLYSNPEDSTNRDSSSQNSGVINYLNKFGRGGLYKSLDPVGELYYEGLRYLQGKALTPAATAGISEAMKDGFPVIESWKDPVTSSCQKNYILSIADANTHWDRYLPGNDRTSFGQGEDANDAMRAAESATDKTPALDVKYWTRLVGEMEADRSGDYGNPAPRPNLANLQNLDTGSSGHGTYYMTGLAYWANTHDIRLDKPVRVKTFSIDVDEGGNGLVDGNPRGLPPRDSQLYLAAKYGGFDDRNGDGNPFITYSAVGKTPTRRSNAEWDGGNGVPANYFMGGQPKEMIRAVRTIFSSIGNDSGTMSGVSASSSTITEQGGYVYQPGFDSSKWSGSLRKLRLALDPQTSTIQLASAAEWDAGEILSGVAGQAPVPAPDSRNIYTAKFGSGKLTATIEFKWDKLSGEQKALLNASPVDDMNDGLGEKRLNYLRGTRALELGRKDGVFRPRGSVLGDIINSNSVYVGAPAPATQGADYQKFYEDNKTRTTAVYVGANDGMLHGFDAENGKELFAYVPAAVMPELNQLTLPEYVHRSYVDGVINVGEAKIGATWKTVLASGMGGGAQGLFALDVTNPSDFKNGSGALFEFTDNDDPAMGNLAGAPLIAKFKTRLVKGVPEYKYFVVAAGGFNNYKDDGAGKFDAGAPGAVFLLSLDKVPSERWREGVNYFKFKTPIKESNLPNGLSAPAVVVGSDGAVRHMYAGDLQGNLWRFDFTGTAPWANALGAAPNQPLFAAKDAQGNSQPITTQAKIVFAPRGGYVVLFGTGKFVEQSDSAPGNFRTQSFYAIHDTTRDGDRVTGRGQLAPRTLKKISSASGDALTIAGDAFSYGASEDGKRGWNFDFMESNQTGERVVANPLLVNGQLFFNSLIPAGDPCSGGGGRAYMLDALNGLSPSGTMTGFASQVGLMSAPLLFETGAAQIGERNAIGKRIVKKKYAVFNFGTGGAKGTALPAQRGTVETALPAGRFSWREVLNWPELREAFKKK